MEPPKRPFHVVRNGNPTNPPKTGIDYKTIGITVAFTTVVATIVGMVIYGVKDRMGRKKNPEPEALMPSPFVAGAPLALQGGHFIYVPAGSQQPRDTNPGLPNALRYTPSMVPPRPVMPVQDPNVAPSWFLAHAQQQEQRLQDIENFLRAPVGHQPDA